MKKRFSMFVVLSAMLAPAGFASAQNDPNDDVVDTVEEVQEQMEENQETIDEAGEAIEDAERRIEAAEEASDAAERRQELLEEAAEEAAEAEAEAEVLRQQAEEANAAAEAAEAEAEAAAEEAEVIETFYRGRWVGALSLNGSFNLTATEAVPGQQNGFAFTLAGALNGNADYQKGRHAWRNSFGWDLAYTRTPGNKFFIKSTDLLMLASGYYFDITSWLAAFVELQAETSVLPTTDRHSERVDYCLAANTDNTAEQCVDGTLNTTSTSDEQDLGSAFSPFELSELLGVAVTPLHTTGLMVRLRAGLQATQFFVSEPSYIVQDISSSNTHILIRRIEDNSLFGVMADAMVRGNAQDGRVQFGADAGIFFPFVGSDLPASITDTESKLHVDTGAFVDFGLADWATLSIRGSADRRPYVTGSTWQKRLNVLLTFGWHLLGDRDAARDVATTLQYQDLDGEVEDLDEEAGD